MNLQQLRYLVATADLGSVSAAARQLGVSQPVVSRALHGLEQEFGLALFAQAGRCLTPTDAGYSVLRDARWALDAFDDVERTARRIAQSTELGIVATPTNSALLSPILTAFVTQRPQAALRLQRASSVEEVLSMITAREVELGFVDLSEELDDTLVATHRVWCAEVVVVSPLGTKLPRAVPVDELARSRLVLPQEGTPRRRKIDAVLGAASGRTPLPALATDERSAWITAAKTGIGSFLSYRAVVAEVDGVEIRPFDPPKWVEVGFVHRADSVSDEAREMLQLASDCPLPQGCRVPSDA
jgi:DNA-binding transcriptional LysR family regulator